MAKKKVIKEKLTAAQTTFCELYAVNNNATASYLIAYPKVAYNTAKTEASRLLTDVNIKGIVAKHKELFINEYMKSKQAFIQDLSNTANEAKAAGKYNEYAKINDMILKLLGMYEAEKIDVTSFNVEIKVSNANKKDIDNL